MIDFDKVRKQRQLCLPVQGAVRPAIGWVEIYAHETVGEIHWPVLYFGDSIYANAGAEVSDGHSIDFSTRAVLPDWIPGGMEVFEGDKIFHCTDKEYPIFVGLRYVGEAAYITAYATFVQKAQAVSEASELSWAELL